MKYETKYRQRSMDLVKELSYEFQVVLEKEHNLKQFNFLKL